MKKKLPLILFFIILLAAVGFGVYTYLASRMRWNDGYVNGNTAGNLYNSGLFCEDGGIVFFANPSDANRLYSMNANGSDIKKLSDDIVTFINADDHYIYYVRNNQVKSGPFSFLNINTDSLCRVDRDGSSLEILDSAPSLYASLLGNYIYYLRYDKEDATSLYKIKIDGSDLQQVDKNPYYTCCTDGSYIYYNGLAQDHNIWRLNTVSDSKQQVYSGNCWMPIVCDASVAYFMDCDHNYKLARADLTTGDVSVLCDDRIDCYNLAGDYLYFQRNDAAEPALCRMRTDGSDYTVIAEGNYTDINVTSHYIYFTDFKSGIMYRTPAGKVVDVKQFDPGYGENK